MEFKPFAVRTAEEMRAVSMYPEMSGPPVHYYMIRGGSAKRNITVWESGTIGNTIGSEYIKTFGHYHLGNLDETYWVLLGEGIVLQQKLVNLADPSVVEEFKVVRVKAGDSVYMPAGYGHLVANIGKTWLVTADNSPVAGPDDSASMPGHADYEAVKQMRGFAYYVVDKNGVPTLVLNPLYKEIRKKDFGGINTV